MKPKMKSAETDHPAATAIGRHGAAPCSAYWNLFSHMADNHGLTLLESELEDICQVVERMRGWQPKEGKYTRWICANCGSPIGRKYRVKHNKLFWSHYMAKGKAGHCCNTPTPLPNKTQCTKCHGAGEYMDYAKDKVSVCEQCAGNGTTPNADLRQDAVNGRGA